MNLSFLKLVPGDFSAEIYRVRALSGRNQDAYEIEVRRRCRSQGNLFCQSLFYKALIFANFIAMSRREISGQTDVMIYIKFNSSLYIPRQSLT